MKGANFPKKNYYFLINPYWKRNIEPITPEKVEKIHSSLDELAGIFRENSGWALTGGLVIALSKGEFYRDHKDIDVVVNQENLRAFVETAQKNQYDLFCKLLSTKITPYSRINVYSRTNLDEALRKHKKLRLIRVNKKSNPIKHSSLADYLDIYPFYREGSKFVSEYNGKRFEFDKVLGKEHVMRSGKKIKLVDLSYLEKIKAAQSLERDRYDKRIIQMML